MAARKVNRIPGATYRLQFHSGFQLKDAFGLLDYLQALGITDVYTSPLFQAAPGSTHGYDVCGFDQINPAVGGSEEFERFAAEVRRRGMGILLDIVPNHMGSHSSNCWWMDVLRNGPQSRYARFFDINWESDHPLLKGKVLLPVLGDRYAAVLERGELKLLFEKGEWMIGYYDARFPLSPESVRHLGSSGSGDAEEVLGKFNGLADNAGSWRGLHELIEQQHYRLAYWRVANEEINYRRFFDVTQLVSVRVEDEQVFRETHALVFELIGKGTVTGLRIDHPDGLRDPKHYFQRLQSAFQQGRGEEELFVVVEKILSEEEKLPGDWPVEGTTGYDFLNQLNGLFVYPQHEEQFTRLYGKFAGVDPDFRTMVYAAKKEILEKSLVSETNSLAGRLFKLAAASSSGRDFTWAELRQAIIEMVGCFPVYRTYVTESSFQLTPPEEAQLAHATEEALKRNDQRLHPALMYLRDTLALKFEAGGSNEKEAREFVLRFQQLSGPATAKGLEDTSFYRFNRLISLNEVGGDPGRFGVRPEEFHAFNAALSKNWPHTLLATATHDTKRGEDTRARINVLSEIPALWETKLERWSRLNEGAKSVVHGKAAPTANDEILLYQTLVGSWAGDTPEYRKRVEEYMLKAVREAKVNTSWTEQNERYEAGIKKFTNDVIGSGEFQADFVPFQERVALFGAYNSISQTVLKLFSPGVPDIYQGTELWDLSLVDPDNRRPVDYDARKRLLGEAEKWKAGDLNISDNIGRAKLYTIARSLRFRTQNLRFFQNARYEPIYARGERAEHLVGFSRTDGKEVLVVVVARFMAKLAGFEAGRVTPELWGDTAIPLPSGVYRDILSGAEHRVATKLQARQAFNALPVAVLQLTKAS